LGTALPGDELGRPLRLLCPRGACAELPAGPGIELIGCDRLDDAIRATWPDIELE
jgi:hypothetical protein